MSSVPPTAPKLDALSWTWLLMLSGLWSCSFLFYKIMVAALPPFTIVLSRVSIAALVLHLILVVLRRPVPLCREFWRDVAIMGLVNNVLPFSMIIYGEARIDSGLAAISNATTPMFAALMAHWLTANEKLTSAKTAGVLLGLGGVVVLVGPDALRVGGADQAIGELLCVAASVVYGLGAVFGRRLRRWDPLHVATGQVTASAVMSLPLALAIDQFWTLPMPGPGVFAAMLGLAIPSTALAYLLFFRILARAGALNVTLVTLLIPVGAVLLGVFALGERLAPQAYAGMGLIALGLMVIDGRLVTRLWRLRTA